MVSRLTQMQARFQQRQIQEKEEKLVKLYENQQQRAFEKVGRGSAGSSDSLTNTSISTGKVRQMFDERRQKAGIDRSYPLEPLSKSTATRMLKAGSNEAKGLPKRNVNRMSRPTRAVAPGVVGIGKKPITKVVENNNYPDEAEKYLEEHADLVRLMNKHNLQDNLDDEEMPRIGFDDLGYDEEIFNGKLANVGGKLPSQTRQAIENQSNVSPAVNKSVVSQNKSIGRPGQRQLVAQVRPRVAPPAGGRTLASPTKTAKSTNSAVNSNNNNTRSESSSSGNSSKPPTPVGSPTKMRSQASNAARMPAPVRPSTRQPTRPNVQRDDLVACTYCQRRFDGERVKKHEEICARTAKKKRRVYDSSKHRASGTDVEPFSKRLSKSKPKITSKTNWRQKHEDFISTIRAAKEAQAYVAKGGNLKDLPPPPASSNPDYIKCPHCGRRFNQQAAARHIPQCASYQFNKPRK